MGKLNVRQYSVILSKLIELIGDVDKSFDMFVTLLKDNHQTKLLAQIIDEYKKQAKAETELKVVSKTKLTVDQESELKNVFGENLDIVNEIDDKIIGGFKVETKNKVYDATINKQLSVLEQKLKSN